MKRSIYAAVLAAFAVAACSETDAPEVPVGVEPEAQNRGDGLPVLLTSKGLGGMEALIGGILVQRGPCLYLDSAPEPMLIVWGDDIFIERDDERGWAVVDSGTGARVSIGDRLRGGGGSLPPAQPISDFSEQHVPEECATGLATQLHSIELVETAYVDDPEFRLPPPPPPPPPAPSIVDSVRERGTDAVQREVLVSGIQDPREALFSHVIAQFREGDSFGPRVACLRDIDDAMLARLSVRHDEIYPVSQCRWDNGRVVLRRTGGPAFFVQARTDCDGRSCAAEGGVTYGNLGGEGHGYVMRPASGGWRIGKTGISWIS